MDKMILKVKIRVFDPLGMGKVHWYKHKALSQPGYKVNPCCIKFTNLFKRQLAVDDHNACRLHRAACRFGIKE